MLRGDHGQQFQPRQSRSSKSQCWHFDAPMYPATWTVGGLVGRDLLTDMFASERCQTSGGVVFHVAFFSICIFLFCVSFFFLSFICLPFILPISAFVISLFCIVRGAAGLALGHGSSFALAFVISRFCIVRGSADLVACIGLKSACLLIRL